MVEMRVKIGGVVIAIDSPHKLESYAFVDNYQPFFTGDSPEVSLKHSLERLPELSGWEKVFDTGGVTRIYTNDGRWAVALHADLMGPLPYRVGIFNEDFLSGEIYTNPACFPGRQVPFPLQYPMAEILMINLLGRGRGLLVHACAVMDGADGLLFAGSSGAGKSTTSRLWSAQAGVVLLSDDRAILRKHGDEFFIYGTPWHGDAFALSPVMAPLRQVFILQHAPANQVRQLSPLEMVSSLFVRCFPPFWYPPGMEYTLQLLNEASQQVPVAELGFVPDSSVITFVRQYLARNARP